MKNASKTEDTEIDNRIRNGRHAIAEAHERHDRFSEKPLTLMDDLRLFAKGFFGPKNPALTIVKGIREI
jgi:hypothetical protein